MNKITLYIKETIDELTNKVTWPGWAELQSSAIVVMVASVIIALFVALMDYGFNNGMEIIYSLFS